MIEDAILEDRFKHKYQLSVGFCRDIESPYYEEYFTDFYQASRFIRDLHVPYGYWNRLNLLNSFDHASTSEVDTECSVARALISGKLRVYRMNSFANENSTILIQGKGTRAFRVGIRQDSNLKPNTHCLSFSSLDEAETFVNELHLTDIEQTKIDELLTSRSFATSSPEKSKSVESLAMQLYEKNLFIEEYLQHSRKPEQKKGSQVETIPASVSEPGNRIVELAPITEPWIEFVLKDDETGEPLPGVNVKLKLADGTSVVAESNANGSIRLDHLAEGVCDIEEILDQDGLEFRAMENVR